MFLPTFAKPVLYEVPTYLAGCPIGTLNRKTKRKKAMENKKIICWWSACFIIISVITI